MHMHTSASLPAYVRQGKRDEVIRLKEQEARRLLVETGRELLKTGLVARTWGNVSCRLDADSFVITPNGLDYTRTEEDDIVVMNLQTGEWKGNHKPSGERGVHAAAYRTFSDVNFVIHTHQTYATAIGLAGFEKLDMTEEERQKLGGIALADYGLPGMKKLTDAVRASLGTGAKTVLMLHHGVLICGESKAETFEKAMLLEEICKRNIKGGLSKKQNGSDDAAAQVLLKKVRRYFGHARLVTTPAAQKCAKAGRVICAQVDDMAQMIGRKIPVVSNNPAEVIGTLKKKNAVIVKGVGIIVRADSEDDAEALKILADKAAVCCVHTSASHRKAAIGLVDAALMRFVYKNKYSKKKEK